MTSWPSCLDSFYFCLDDDIRYTTLKVGKSKRQAPEVQANETWEDCCSFFVYSLAKDKVSDTHSNPFLYEYSC